MIVDTAAKVAGAGAPAVSPSVVVVAAAKVGAATGVPFALNCCIALTMPLTATVAGVVAAATAGATTVLAAVVVVVAGPALVKAEMACAMPLTAEPNTEGAGVAAGGAVSAAAVSTGSASVVAAVGAVAAVAAVAVGVANAAMALSTVAGGVDVARLPSAVNQTSAVSIVAPLLVV